MNFLLKMCVYYAWLLCVFAWSVLLTWCNELGWSISDIRYRYTFGFLVVTGGMHARPASLGRLPLIRCCEKQKRRANEPDRENYRRPS